MCTALSLLAKTRRPVSFYLSLTVAGYLALSLVLYCFGQSFLDPSGNCDVPQCWDPRYAHDPAAFWLLVPGAILGLLGAAQLRLHSRCTSKANSVVLRRSFQCSALAVLGIAISLGLRGDARTVAAITALAFFCAGVLFSVANLLWNLLSPGKISTTL